MRLRSLQLRNWPRNGPQTPRRRLFQERLCMYTKSSAHVFIGCMEEWSVERIFEFLLKPCRGHWGKGFQGLRPKWSFMIDKTLRFNDTKHCTSSDHTVYSNNMLSVLLIPSAKRELENLVDLYPSSVLKQAAKAAHKWFDWQWVRRTLCPDLQVWLTSVILSGTAVSLVISLRFTWKQFSLCTVIYSSSAANTLDQYELVNWET